MTIVCTLMAGAKGTESVGVDETGKVYVLDENGKPIKEAPESIATQVRKQIDRSKMVMADHEGKKGEKPA